MVDECLTGLALMYKHPEIKIDTDKVINQFAKQKCPRHLSCVLYKVKFVLWSFSFLLYTTHKMTILAAFVDPII